MRECITQDDLKKARERFGILVPVPSIAVGFRISSLQGEEMELHLVGDTQLLRVAVGGVDFVTYSTLQGLNVLDVVSASFAGKMRTELNFVTLLSDIGNMPDASDVRIWFDEVRRRRGGLEISFRLFVRHRDCRGWGGQRYDDLTFTDVLFLHRFK